MLPEFPPSTDLRVALILPQDLARIVEQVLLGAAGVPGTRPLPVEQIQAAADAYATAMVSMTLAPTCPCCNQPTTRLVRGVCSVCLPELDRMSREAGRAWAAVEANDAAGIPTIALGQVFRPSSPDVTAAPDDGLPF